jgi:hypothetical protein
LLGWISFWNLICLNRPLGEVSWSIFSIVIWLFVIWLVCWVQCSTDWCSCSFVHLFGCFRALFEYVHTGYGTCIPFRESLWCK